MLLQGEVPDEAGVRVVGRRRGAVRRRHHRLRRVRSVHVAVRLHVVASQHVRTYKKHPCHLDHGLLDKSKPSVTLRRDLIQKGTKVALGQLWDMDSHTVYVT